MGIDIPLDYATLRVIWWLLLGVLLIAFAVMDGFDMGVGMLLPFVAQSDTERRIVINTIAPVWEGNQVWFVLGGGSIFAAWPLLYATAFSGFYVALFLVLAALILRPVGFKFRSKIADPLWRSVWDWALFIGGAVPALVFGVAMGNVLQGVPFHIDGIGLSIYEGGFFALLNPFALLCGGVSVSMLIMHGGSYLAMKTEGEVAENSRDAGRWAAVIAAVLFALGGVWLYLGIDGYVIETAANHAGPSNPLLKTVAIAEGAWFNNYDLMPWTMSFPVLGVLLALLVAGLSANSKDLFRFLLSGFSVAMIVATAGFALFPFILPSSTDPASSLTVWDASSSHGTLFIMLVATIIFLPIILVYTSWLYKVMGGRVTAKYLEETDQAY